MDWTLTLNGIGGFQNEHQFLLKEGCNKIYAPNATGKSSLIQAIKLLSPMKKIPPNVLNSNSLVGSVHLQNSSGFYKIKLIRTSEGTIIAQDTAYLSDNNFAEKLAFLTSDHILISGADEHDEILIKKWINEITNLQYYEKAYSICSKILVKYKLLKEKDQIALYNQRKQLDLLIRTEKDKVTELETRLADIRIKSEGSIEIDKLNTQLKEFKTKLDKIEEDIRTFNTINEKKHEIAALNSKISKLKEELELCGNELKIKKYKIPEIDKLIEKNEEKQEQINQELQRLANLCQKIEFQISLYIGTLSSDEDTCIHCGNKISKDLIKEKKTELDDIMASYNNEKQEYSEQIRNLIEQKTALEHEKVLYQTKLPEKERLLSSQVQVTLHKLDLQNEALHTLQKLVHHLKKTDLMNQQIEINEKSMEIQNKLISLTSVDEKNQSEQKILVQKIKLLKDSIKNKEVMLEKCDRQIDDLKKFDILIDRLNLIKKRIQNNIYFIQEEFLDLINDNLKSILETLDLPALKSIFINDGLSITITRPNLRKGRYDELSNYERKLISIIIGISAKNAYLPEFPMFIIDEPLDSADDLRFEKTIKYIKEKVPILIVTKPVSDQQFNTKLLSQANIQFC